MTQLELQQRGLLDLIKGRGATSDDPYLQLVAGSRELAMMREIAIWWRKYQLEAQCRLTSNLLKQLNYFDGLVMGYFNSHATSPFVEELSHGFLNFLNGHDDALVRTVARFEDALLEIRSGSTTTFEVLWDRHPDHVFLALESGSELPAPEPDCQYRMLLDANVPQLVSCTREQLTRD